MTVSTVGVCKDILKKKEVGGGGDIVDIIGVHPCADEALIR